MSWRAVTFQELAALGYCHIAVEATEGELHALTLGEWRRRFLASWPDAVQLGFDERLRRTWECYHAYCEAGFRVSVLNVGLYKMERAE